MFFCARSSGCGCKRRQPKKNKLEGGWGGCFLFLPFWGTPKDMDLRNAYV